jgi:hypothetical protein
MDTGGTGDTNLDLEKRLACVYYWEVLASRIWISRGIEEW